jgi:NAD(P)-dependent dehydrogenase (short-subunit alcohol dehydrogenase family)
MKSMALLNEKIILVTGGSTGIGRATSEILAREGATVIIGDIQNKEGEDTVAAIKEEGGAAEYYHMDVVNFEQVRDVVAEIVGRYGSLDGAHNNAGIEGPASKILDYPTDEWDRVMRINLTGVFNCIKCEIEQMVAQGNGGSIVSTASVAGLVGFAGSASYNASKHGVVGLTKTVALEYAAKNIRVNAVCPGFVETPMLNRLTGDENNKIKERMLGRVPMKRIAAPSEIGDAVAWLLSAKSSYMTGVALPVDGGWMAQ